MNDKQFTDELFSRMYDLGYRRAEIENGTIFFYKNRECISQWSNRVDIRSTCFTEENQQIDIGEYIGIIDWSKVPVDTPILVKDDCDDKWEKAYFAKHEDEMIYAWNNGRTSFSARNKDDTFIWDRAKLAKV
jgi:hypothetical protein|nr:MAG TPA: hypothetical protein [Caudoviricetes sp.]